VHALNDAIDESFLRGIRTQDSDVQADVSASAWDGQPRESENGAGVVDRLLHVSWRLLPISHEWAGWVHADAASSSRRVFVGFIVGSGRPSRVVDMARRSRCPSEVPAWPERWPVLAPAAGSGLAVGGVVLAITEGDWNAAIVFLVPAATLGVVARRNHRACCDAS
jgi:hypothetical protein